VGDGKAFSGFMNRRGFLRKLTRTAFAFGAFRLLVADGMSVKAATVSRHGSAFSAAFSEEFH